MNVLLYTIGLYEGRERLMPWRTLLEVACEMNKKGHKAVVFSGSSVVDDRKDELRAVLNDKKIDVLFYPFSWRDGLTGCLGFLKSVECKKIGYVTGGVYSLRGCFFLGLSTSFLSVLPYLFDCIVPKCFVLRKLKVVGFSSIVTFSNYTRSKCVSSVWNEEVFTILPGLDDFGTILSDSSCFYRCGLAGRKYFLFAGSPAPIRGSEWLIRAFDELCDSGDDFLLVMLMRTDVMSDYDFFDSVYAKVRNKKNILVVRDKVSPSELKCFVSNAWAVIFPFLLIPSEIPLSFFEVLSCGSSVVAFENGGSTRYLDEAVLSVKVGDKKRFLRVLSLLWRDAALRERLKRNAISLMSGHPSWQDVGGLWINLLR